MNELQKLTGQKFVELFNRAALFFPTEDPEVFGAFWINAGVLTVSDGPAELPPPPNGE